MATFSVTCPHCNEAFEVETPAKVSKPRGQLAGIPLSEMTDDQLKREIINANSVLYKAKQRGASEDIIAKNQARVDAAKAERDARHPVTAPEAEGVADALTETDEEVAAEV